MKRTNNCPRFLEMFVKLSSPHQGTIYENLGKTINLDVRWKSQGSSSFKSRMGHSDEPVGALPQRV